ncbi:MAG: UDP-glucose 4-epimerase GalE [Elusimicrobia bacterium HGW-Elusimicrobia-3]|nr:MAG: UDP-glucose 4-epimerase GalE [Elusimicrobia bacterium HGW-Elusimicrobia-3]
MEKIAVIGGAGYIGSHVCKLLKQSGYSPVVFDNLSTGHRRLVRWGEFFKGDLGSISDLLRFFKKHKVRAVMHFSAFAYVGESVDNPAKYYLNNVANTINLLNAMRNAGVNRFVFSSSCAVYGEPVALPMRENMPFNPISPYGRTKKIVEEMLVDYNAAYGLKFTALRYFNAAGADPDGETGELHCPETHLIPLVLDAAAGRRPYIKVFGGNYKTPDGTCLRDYVHVADLAQAHLLALRCLERGEGGGAFNLGNGNGFSVLEVIEMAEKVTGLKIPVKMVPRRAGDPAALVASSLRIQRNLGWKPQYNSLETIIRHAWAWHRKIR